VARSHAEARATFHRASKDLIPALERDKENDLPEPTSDDREHDDDQAEGEGDGEPTAVTEAAGPADETAAVVVEEGKGEPSVDTMATGAADEPAAVVVEEEAALETDADPAEGLGSEGEDDVPPGADQPTRPWFEVVPKSACRREGWLPRNEPENRVDASAQVVEDPISSVDLGPAAPGRQNGVLSAAPALPETPHRPESSPGGMRDPGAARTSRHYGAVGRHHYQPAGETAPSRWVTGGTTARGDGSRNEPENGTITSAQSPAAKARSVADRRAEPSRQTNVLNPARPPGAGNPKAESPNKNVTQAWRGRGHGNDAERRSRHSHGDRGNE
jgi:hypothetical protein